jgi:hypothetical protein
VPKLLKSANISNIAIKPVQYAFGQLSNNLNFGWLVLQLKAAGNELLRLCRQEGFLSWWGDYENLDQVIDCEWIQVFILRLRSCDYLESGNFTRLFWVLCQASPRICFYNSWLKAFMTCWLVDVSCLRECNYSGLGVVSCHCMLHDLGCCIVTRSLQRLSDWTCIWNLELLIAINCYFPFVSPAEDVLV